MNRIKIRGSCYSFSIFCGVCRDRQLILLNTNLRGDRFLLQLKFIESL